MNQRSTTQRPEFSPHRNHPTPTRSALRFAAILGGSALAVYGIARRSKSGIAMAAAGGILAASNARNPGHAHRYSAEASFAINCSPADAYRFWRNFENLPRFMRHLQSVKSTGNNRSEWTALGPGDVPVQWTAEMVEDREAERISWRSLPGSQLENGGSVQFRQGPSGRGTIVTAKMAYVPPGGGATRIAAKIFGKDPEFAIREDLRRFKALMETGEVPTTRNQPHGPRGLHGHASEVMFREPQNQLPSQPQQQPAERRTA